VTAQNIVFFAGDILHDENLQDIGVLLECHDSLRDIEHVSGKGVPIWRTWWIRAGAENYSEEGLQNLVDLGVFACYSIVEESIFYNIDLKG
jgi:hypothetical protein